MRMNRDTVLIVDDDDVLRRVLVTLLEREGFNVVEAPDARTCLHLVYERHPDLVLLDILMPDRDGREVCRLLHDIDPQLPIVMLSALSEENEKVGRLGDGADDYIVKPFHNQELVARLQAVLRRSRQAPAHHARLYKDSMLSVDFDSRQLLVNGEEVALSPKLWRLLEYMINHKDRVVSREELLRYAWGNGYEGEHRYLKVFISHLRQRLGENPKRPRYIFTAREQGYLFQSHA